MATSTVPRPAGVAGRPVIYECVSCGERTTDRRCPDCNTFTSRLGTGGHCPHCDELTLHDELLTPEQPDTTAPSHTENLTGSRSTP